MSKRLAKRWRSVAARLLPVVPGVLFAAPWLAPSVGWVSWPASAVLVGMVRHRPPRSAFARAWLFGVAAHTTGFYWIAQVLTDFARLSPSISWPVAVLLNCVQAMQFGLFGMIVAWLARRNYRCVLHIPVVWTALEFLWPSIFPWRLGQTQLHWAAFLQVAEFTGVYGPGFVIMWGGATLAFLVPLLVGERGGDSGEAADRLRRCRRSAIACLFVTGGIVAFGYWRIGDVKAELRDERRFRVALIQPATTLRHRAATCRSLSARLAAGVDLICWPESTIGAYPLASTDFALKSATGRDRRERADLLVRLGAPVLVGGLSQDQSTSRYYNSAFLVDSNSKVLGRYHKRQLTPFGEYIPGAERFPWLRRLSPYPQVFAAGESSQPLETPDGAKLGVLICYEDTLADAARRSAAAGAEVLVNLTNDMWFGRSVASLQHQQLAALRAIENRRYLIRCSTTGSTAVISPTGDVVAQAPLFDAATLTVDVALRDDRTVYCRVGDLFAWLCVGGAAVAVAFGFFRSGRHNAQTSGQGGAPPQSVPSPR